VPIYRSRELTCFAQDDKRVRFVGLEGYETQGGLVRRDLFAEGENGVYIEDAVLLDQLVANKLL
jgi:hypothetical protein